MSDLSIRRNGERLYDTYSIQRITGVNRSKVQREIRKLDPPRIQHKNQYLYGEETLFCLMEKVLSERLNKIEHET
jgi:hypothetical protein